MQEQKTRKVDETDFGKQLKDVLEDWAQATIATHGVELIDGEETELHLALPLRVKVRAEKGDGEPMPGILSCNPVQPIRHRFEFSNSPIGEFAQASNRQE